MRTSNLPFIRVLVLYVLLPAGLLVQMLGIVDLPTQSENNASNINGMFKSSIIESNRLAPVSCVHLLASDAAELKDPNRHRMFLRYTTDHFWISLHEKNYDPVRWQTMHYGKYYEQKMVGAT